MKRALGPALLALALHTSAQHVIVSGKLRDFDTAAALAAATIGATDPTGASIPAIANDTGGYTLRLPFDHAWELTFRAGSHVPKRILMDTRGIPAEERRNDFVITVDATLMEPEPEVDYSALDRPIGRCAYAAQERTVAWDLPYTRERSAAIRALMEEHQRAHQRISPPATH